MGLSYLDGTVGEYLHMIYDITQYIGMSTQWGNYLDLLAKQKKCGTHEGITLYNDVTIWSVISWV